MAKANKKATKVESMNAGFDTLIKTLGDIITTTEELMPLASASLGLTIKIVRVYQKAFNAGTKYAK